MDYTTIKIPEQTYELTKRLQAEIAKNGFKNLPLEVKGLLADKTCPFDFNTLQKNEELGYNWYICRKCNYQKQIVDTYQASTQEILGSIALAAIITLGLVALANYLAKK
ncbi:MAG: hypothetical protein HY362_02995 [Candidatus Aenigmarchaeota archaeon]|nr:hypothetical protein [Candidatus Aenigmarchaeota archaeon]